MRLMCCFFFFSSRRRHTRCSRDWSSDVCSSDLAHGFLASLNFPGPGYLEVISMFHSHLRPRTYLEIGVETGQSMALVRRETRAIGIDPEPKITHPLAAATSIHATTSDEYFAAHD